MKKRLKERAEQEAEECALLVQLLQAEKTAALRTKELERLRANAMPSGKVPRASVENAALHAKASPNQQKRDESPAPSAGGSAFHQHRAPCS
eukprot:5860854-Pleurochrysis_carterae.AAC.1